MVNFHKHSRPERKGQGGAGAISSTSMVFTVKETLIVLLCHQISHEQKLCGTMTEEPMRALPSHTFGSESFWKQCRHGDIFFTCSLLYANGLLRARTQDPVCS